MTETLRVRGRWFRVLKPLYAHEPLSVLGAQIHGGRFNRIGQPAFYLSADPQTAYAEYTQDLYDRPGLMCSYDVDAAPVADLTDAAVIDQLGTTVDTLQGAWLGTANPPGQLLAERLFSEGWAGATYHSVQHPDGVNLVLWSSEESARFTISLLDRLSEAPTRPIR